MTASYAADPSAGTGTGSLRDLWRLDPDSTFLNHGSFGACPTAVLAHQTALRDRLERQPVRFFIRDLEDLLDEALAALGRFVGAQPQDLARVTNATAGVNTVLAALQLQPGDELLTTDHAYGACRNALEHVAAKARARVVVAKVPFPLASAEEVSAPILAAVTPRTRLALVDHVTSPTGLVLPVERLVPALQARGVDVLVDGAHAPGMVPLDLDGLGAAYYTGNCHKWLCTPKGAAFLHVRRDRQPGVRPLCISHAASTLRTDRSRFSLEFGWTGTDDPTAFLCVPEAIRYLGALRPGGWPAWLAANRHLALQARDRLCAALAIPAPCPDEMIGSLAAVPLPPDLQPAAGCGAVDGLQDLLWTTHRIEVPVMPWPPWWADDEATRGRRVLRVAAQAYNDLGQFERLAGILRALAS